MLAQLGLGGLGGAGANYECFCDPRIDALLAYAGATLERARDATSTPR